MSRSRRGQKPLGYEFNARRPGNESYCGLSGRHAKTVTHRRERRIAKRALLGFLALVLFCGCVRVTPTPPSDSTIDGIGKAYAATFRQTCLDAAGKLRSGEWSTDRQYRDGHLELVRKAVEAAGQPFADRQQAEATPFTPEGMADWLERVAGEGQ